MGDPLVSWYECGVSRSDEPCASGAAKSSSSPSSKPDARPIRTELHGRDETGFGGVVGGLTCFIVDGAGEQCRKEQAKVSTGRARRAKKTGDPNQKKITRPPRWKSKEYRPWRHHPHSQRTFERGMRNSASMSAS